MPQYELFHPDTEILGQVLIGFEDAVGAEAFLPTLEHHGLTGLDPETWYSAQIWVDVLNSMATRPGAMMDFVSLGRQQMEQVDWPPEFRAMTLVEVLQALDQAYREYYRGTDIGWIKAEMAGERLIKVTVRSFEPDDLWYGNIFSLTRIFGEPGKRYIVHYDESVPRREQGGEVTILYVEW